MNAYTSIAQNIHNIARFVRDGKMDFKDIPFAKITEIVQSIYKNKSYGGDYYAELYGILFIKSLEHKDREELASALALLAEHVMILSQDEIDRGRLNDKNWRLQSENAYFKNCERVKCWHEVNGDRNSAPFEGRGVVYSAITGNYDNIKEPSYVNPNLDYILFTNNPQITSSVWQVRLVENPEGLDNVRLARRIKILGHEYLPEYDYSIWVDGKLEIKDDLRDYVDSYRRKEPILCFNHYINECIYDEKLTCEALNKDDPQIMEKQMERYREEGYPVKNGLIESGLMVRELKNEKVQQVMNTWWQEVMSGSRRDQLSFNYACWKNNFVYDSTDLFIYGNRYVKLYGHNEF